MARWQHGDSTAVLEGDTLSQALVNGNVEGKFVGIVGAGSVAHHLEAMSIVELGAVLHAVAQQDGTNGILIGEIDSGASRKIVEIPVAVLAARRGDGCKKH